MPCLPRRVVVLVAGLGGAAVLAACGAGASTYTDSGGAAPSGNNSKFVRFAECMRWNGVPNLPDPTGGGIQISNGINPQSPAFQAARAKCKHLLPGGGPPSGPPSAQAKLAMLKISECMRAHGITGFPDPTTKLPTSPAGYGEAIDHGGVVLAVPSTINVQSPAYQQAASACNFH
jgi:hypothetical protein